MELKLDISREYGLVLEGGGAKGAYQIGAWRALREAGVKIRGIAGASVGALNGALICMDDLEKAEEVWENIRYSTVMDVEDNVMESLLKLDFKSLSLQDMMANAKEFLKNKGFDVGPLHQLIGEIVDEEKIRKSGRELYVTTFSMKDHKLLVVDMREVPEGCMGDVLLASAYLPVFHLERPGGMRYVDGAGLNNVPVDALLDRGYTDIIVLRIYGLGRDTERSLEIPEGVNLHHVAPRQNLGGILEFDRQKSRRNMKLGYYDAKRMIWGLAGKRYYIDAPQGEREYLEGLMDRPELLKHCARLAGGKEELPDSWRGCMEKLFPRAAARLKLGADWDYRDLFLAVLEDAARELRIGRFRIYTDEELAEKVKLKKMSLLDSPGRDVVN